MSTKSNASGSFRFGHLQLNSPYAPPYMLQPDGIYLTQSSNAPGRNHVPTVIETRLTNFLAFIDEQEVIDDGDDDSRIRRRYHILAVTEDGRTSRFWVASEEFLEIQKVVDRYIGPPATLFPEVYNCRDHVIAAIKLFSRQPHTTHKRTHTGWASIDGRNVFLHAGGSIQQPALGRPAGQQTDQDAPPRPRPISGADNGMGHAGPSGPSPATGHGSPLYCTQLPQALRDFVLPPPITGEELKQAIKAALLLRRIGPLQLSYPLLCAAFRAPLGQGTLYIHLVGETDSGKTEVASLFQRFFGPAMGPKRLPASWAATANYLERLLYHGKDVLIVIDDYLTKSDLADKRRQEAKADQVLRGLFNSSGRGRAQGDGSIRDSYPPRGIVVSTGEIAFKIRSILNRGLNPTVRKDELDWAAITLSQEYAGNGTLARAMSSYISFLSRNGDGFAGVRKHQAQLEDRAREELPTHGRSAGIVASLYVGWLSFLAFAYEAKAISEEDGNNLQVECWDSLIKAVRSQPAVDAEPIEFFFSCLQAALVAGRAHLAGPEGDCPNLDLNFRTEPEAYGWQRWSTKDQVKEYPEDDGAPTTRTVAVTSGYRPKGERVGWLLGSNLYLLPLASLRAANAVARGVDESIELTKETLGKLMYEQGLLLRSERSRGRYTARENLGGMRPNVLILNSSHLMPPKAEHPSECRLYDCEDDEVEDVIKSFEGLIA